MSPMEQQSTVDRPQPSVKSDKRDGKEADIGTRQDDEAFESSSSTAPIEDWYAWMQLLGAFCLNLNTW